MSSAIPSEKNSCSGSALKFLNGRTAIEGLSASWSVLGDHVRSNKCHDHLGSKNVATLPDCPQYALRVVG